MRPKSVEASSLDIDLHDLRGLRGFFLRSLRTAAARSLLSLNGFRPSMRRPARSEALSLARRNFPTRRFFSSCENAIPSCVFNNVGRKRRCVSRVVRL